MNHLSSQELVQENLQKLGALFTLNSRAECLKGDLSTRIMDYLIRAQPKSLCISLFIWGLITQKKQKK